MESLSDPIYVVGYRRSGTVWLSHLLGDALNAPIGGAIEAWDPTDIATYGSGRESKYFIRRGHFLVVKNNRETNGHIMAFSAIRRSKVFLIVRDPRDVVVSVSHFWRIPIESALHWITEGKSEMNRTGSWCSFMDSWLDSGIEVQRVYYESLYKDTSTVLKEIMENTGISASSEALKWSVERNTYAQRRVRIITDEITHAKGRAFLFRHMVQPAVGDWKNYMLHTGMLTRLEVCFGNLLSYFGY
jgi:hypothetical protein